MNNYSQFKISAFFKNICYKAYCALAILSLGLLLAGCSSNRITPEQMEKELAGFQAPVLPEKGKALVYLTYDQRAPLSIPKKISLAYGKIDQDHYERNTGQLNAVFKIFTLGAFEDDPNTNTKKIGNLTPGEYRILSLDPGYYEFQYAVVTPSEMACNPHPKFLVLEAGKIYYINIEWDIFFNRYSSEVVHNLYIRPSKDELSGRYNLSKNFKKAEDV